MVKETFTPEETKQFGFELGKNAKSGDIYCLDGDLGVEKQFLHRDLQKDLVLKMSI